MRRGVAPATPFFARKDTADFEALWAAAERCNGPTSPGAQARHLFSDKATMLDVSVALNTR